MQRRLSLFIAILFLAVQAFSAVHMAEYGFAKHEHNGHICDVYLHGEQCKTANTGTSPVIVGPEFTGDITQPLYETVAQSQRYSASAPRAPPSFS